MVKVANSHLNLSQGKLVKLNMCIINASQWRHYPYILGISGSKALFNKWHILKETCNNLHASVFKLQTGAGAMHLNVHLFIR